MVIGRTASRSALTNFIMLNEESYPEEEDRVLRS
jgi:hypothetical protein